jgi:sugar-specific transcriptional regulator TrmB
MKAELNQVLAELGVSPKGIEIYLFLLKQGCHTASAISKNIQAKRGFTYNRLAELKTLGLIHEYEFDGVARYEAASAEILVSLLERREEEIERNRTELLQLLPRLEKLKSPRLSPPKVRFYQGQDGLEEILLETVDVPESEIRAFLDLEKANLNLGPGHSDFIDRYVATRLERNIWLYGIVPQDSLDREDKLRGVTGPGLKREFRTLTGYIPTAEIYIYRGRVSIITSWKQNVGLTIEDPGIFNTFWELHLSLWGLLPKTSEVRS